MAPTRPLLTHNVTVYETVPAWPSGSYEIVSFGFGAPDLATAKAEGERQSAAYLSRTGRKHRAEIRLFCTVCKVSGIKPGCKRKRCEACGGKGSIALPEAETVAS